MAPQLGTLNRIVAGVIGVIWIAAGVAAVVLGIPAHQWGTVLLGVLAIYFGGIWWHVARKGRYAVWPFGS
ncbi:MAG TPA: hypothetical protein VFK36_13515 [Gemmatimonadales bacterium]|nr:hypothetical protein [Gemmatimonadales bacterium]